MPLTQKTTEERERNSKKKKGFPASHSNDQKEAPEAKLGSDSALAKMSGKK
jgi:hypothetical protein